MLDRWISSVQAEAAGETGLEPGDPALTKAVDQKIYTVTSAVSELVHGFEFARLLSLYYHAYLDGDDETKARVTRWFRGEYTLKREAKEELGVNILITDDDWYDYLKLFAVFFRMAGYTGMILLIDELVNLYKIPTPSPGSIIMKAPDHVQRCPPGKAGISAFSWARLPRPLRISAGRVQL